MRLGPETDADTHASWLAMIELTISCHEPALAPVLSIARPRVLQFPIMQSRDAS
jgi:hypothetical protein